MEEGKKVMYAANAYTIVRKTLALALITVFTLTQSAYPLPEDIEIVEGEATVNIDGSTMTAESRSDLFTPWCG